MHNIKKIYLYLVSTIALVIWVVGAIMLVNMALKAWVFTKADTYSYSMSRSAVCDTQNVDVKMYPECAPGYAEEQKRMEVENRTSQRQRDASQALSMILIAAPVWFFHWRLAKQEA